MRFELSVALKYLLPQPRQLSTSIISLISIVVISLVVWLVIIFLSVTEGIEKKWIEQLVSLNAPLRAAPTEEYYRSYYYQIDNQCTSSGYCTKTIGEKLSAEKSDPYDQFVDAELPPYFPSPETHPDGSLKDLAKEAYTILSGFPHLRAKEYEISFGNLHLDLVRDEPTFLTQVSYISSFDPQNERMQRTLLSPTTEELNSFLPTLTSSGSKAAFQQWVKVKSSIPSDPVFGEGILISKSFSSNGVLLGDRGFLSYYTPTPTSVQEQKIPIFVASFYDPGFMAVGNKVIYVSPKIIAMLRGNVAVADPMLGNGINIFLPDISKTEETKTALVKAFKERGLDRYFSILAYGDYEFARPILQQLESDKTLFMLIAIIILIVACSNIISMLILLVNDKKKEIGIMLSMGASPKRIAYIFGFCGATTGIISSAIGSLAAVFTLRHLQSLVDFLSFLQGHEAFQAAFYGKELPNTFSYSALLFVLIATLFISLVAGIVPAMKAARLRPSEILRAE